MRGMRPACMRDPSRCRRCTGRVGGTGFCGTVEVHITHIKLGETDPVMNEIDLLVTASHLERRDLTLFVSTRRDAYRFQR